MGNLVFIAAGVVHSQLGWYTKGFLDAAVDLEPDVKSIRFPRWHHQRIACARRGLFAYVEPGMTNSAAVIVMRESDEFVTVTTGAYEDSPMNGWLVPT
jgi:hypothetical protein